MSPGAPANPFSTRHHRAGALPYRFEGPQSAATLLDRWFALGAEAQIVGAEGTGKSTLLHALAGEAERRGLALLRFTIDTEGHLPSLDAALARRAPPLLFVDEADRLSFLSFHRLRRRARAHGIGLLASTHRSLGLATLHGTSVHPALATAIAAQILDESPSLPRLVRPEEAGEILDAHGGNLRRVWLALYDRYEARFALARAGAPAASR